MTECTVSGNSARDIDSGAIYIGNNTTVVLSRCNLTGNSANYRGGAIYVSGGSNLTLTQCVISGNSSGAIHNDRANVTMTDCTISDNSSESLAVAALLLMTSGR